MCVCGGGGGGADGAWQVGGTCATHSPPRAARMSSAAGGALARQRGFRRGAGRSREALHGSRARGAPVDDVRPLGNRSAALAKLGRFEDALADADRGLRAPRWAKGHGRRGTALFYLARFSEAEAAFMAGLQVTAADEGCRNGLKMCRDVISLGSNDRERAAGLFKAATSSPPGSTNACLRCSRTAARSLVVARRTPSTRGNAPRLYAAAARSACDDHQRALQHTEACVSLRPGWPKACPTSGGVLWTWAPLGRARRAARAALDLRREYERAILAVDGGERAGQKGRWRRG